MCKCLSIFERKGIRIFMKNDMETSSRMVKNKELFIANGLMRIFMTSGLKLSYPKSPSLSVCVIFAFICSHILKNYAVYHTILLALHLIFCLRDGIMKNKFENACSPNLQRKLSMYNHLTFRPISPRGL